MKLVDEKLLLPFFRGTFLFFIGAGSFTFFARRIFLWAGLRFFTFTFLAGFLLIASGFAFSTAGFSFLLVA